MDLSNLREAISESGSDLVNRIFESYKTTNTYLKKVSRAVGEVYSGHILVSLDEVLQEESEFWGKINGLREIKKKKVVSEILFDTSYPEDNYITYNLFIPIKLQDLDTKTQTRIQLSNRYDKITENSPAEKTVHLMEDWFHSREKVFVELNGNNYQVKIPTQDNFLLLQVTIPRSQRIPNDDLIRRLKEEQPSYFKDIKLEIDTIYYHDWFKDSIRKTHPKKQYTTKEASRMTGVSTKDIHEGLYRSRKGEKGTDFITIQGPKRKIYFVLKPGIEKIRSLHK